MGSQLKLMVLQLMDDIVGAIPPWLPQNAFRVGILAYPYEYHHSLIVQRQINRGASL